MKSENAYISIENAFCVQPIQNVFLKMKTRFGKTKTRIQINNTRIEIYKTR